MKEVMKLWYVITFHLYLLKMTFSARHTRNILHPLWIRYCLKVGMSSVMVIYLPMQSQNNRVFLSSGTASELRNILDLAIGMQGLRQAYGKINHGKIHYVASNIQPYKMMTYQSYFCTVSRVGVIYKLLKRVFDDETWSYKRP